MARWENIQNRDSHTTFKPKVVTGCVLEYQYVEVTHSAIQLAFGVAGLVIAAFVAHFYITGRTTNYNSFFCLHFVKKIINLPEGKSKTLSSENNNPLSFLPDTPSSSWFGTLEGFLELS